MTLAEATEAYAAYVNGRPRAVDQLRHEDLADYDADLEKARAVMETAWLEQTAVISPDGR